MQAEAAPHAGGRGQQAPAGSWVGRLVTSSEVQQSLCTALEPNINEDFGGLEKMAERTGLEPATPGVTGRYSNQLNYRSR